METNPRETARLKRKKRIRKNLSGTVERPRLTVFRAHKHMYAQVIDDTTGKTLAAASTLSPEYKALEPCKGKIEKAKRVGTLVARKAIEAGVAKVVFDRSGYIYHGRVKALADAAREAGLDF